MIKNKYVRRQAGRGSGDPSEPREEPKGVYTERARGAEIQREPPNWASDCGGRILMTVVMEIAGSSF